MIHMAPVVTALRSLFCTASILGCLSSVASAQEWIAERSGQFVYAPNNKNIKTFFDSLAIGKRVFLYYTQDVDPNTGIGWHNVHLTNGERHRGFTVCSETVYTGDGVELKVTYRLGVNPRGAQNVRRDITMSPEAWKRVKAYTVRAGWCPKPNQIIEGVKSFVDTVLYVFKDGERVATPKPTTPPPPASKQLHYVWATVHCARPGSTGSVIADTTSEESCQSAKDSLQSDASSGKLCLAYAQDAKFTGEISMSECGLVASN